MTVARSTAANLDGPRSAYGVDKDFLFNVVDRLLSCRQGTSGHAGSFSLSQSEVAILCKAASASFSDQPGLLRLSPGLIIVGDIHGQYDDLLRVFKAHGPPAKTRYLFLGDYVDRGPDGLEVVCLLMAYHLLYPDNVHLIRGNHECCTLTLMYGFYAECLSKSGVEAWREVTDAFTYLPLAALIGNKIFCVHGGISPRLENLEQINEIKRPAIIQHELPELLTDLVWSDPAPYVKGWQKNPRGAGYFFGVNTVRAFKQRFGLIAIVRSHEAQKKGYNLLGKSGLVTVFSAPNYRSTGNTGATMIVSQDCTFRFRTFPPLDKNGEPLVPSTHPSEEWTMASAPAIPPRVPDGEVAQRPAYVSPFAALSGALPSDIPFGLTDAAGCPAPPAQVPLAPGTATSSPFSGLQYAAFDKAEEAEPVGREGMVSTVMPSPFALAQSQSSDDNGPVQDAGRCEQEDCSTRTSSGSSQHSESSCFSAGSVDEGMPVERTLSAPARSADASCPTLMEGTLDYVAERIVPMQSHAVMASPFAALSQSPSMPSAIIPMDASPAMMSPFAAYMGNADAPAASSGSSAGFHPVVPGVSSSFSWALRQDSLALHKGAPALYNTELRSSYSISPPLGTRTTSSALPPVEESPNLRAPPADAKRLAWRAASSQSSARSLSRGNGRDAVSSTSSRHMAPSSHMMPPPAVRPCKGAFVSSFSKRGPVISQSWLETGERSSSGISQPSPRSSLSTFTSASSSTSTSNSSAEVMEFSERGFVRRAASAFVKAQIRSGAPFFGRSRSAGNTHPVIGAKVRALEVECLSAWPRRKLAADGEFRRIPSDPATFVSSLVEPLSGS